MVFLDLDDTIFDHSLTCRAALRELRRAEPRLGVLPLDRLWRSYLERLEGESLTLGPVGRPPSVYEEARAARFRALAAASGWACSSSEARELSARYRKHYQRLRRAVPGAVELVHRVARTRRVGIVTNNQVPEQVAKVGFLGLTKTIDYLIISEAIGAEKPDRAIYRAALAEARVRPRDAVMVGDSWTNRRPGRPRVGDPPGVVQSVPATPTDEAPGRGARLVPPVGSRRAGPPPRGLLPARSGPGDLAARII